ncbi:MAG: tetratricopeptide repeat protein [Calditrichaeota bacterium]|nr:tetratricopeptide repeat protein [Calditrichota bacterium]
MTIQNETVSPYIHKVKDWKIRQIFWGYFAAMYLFVSNYDQKKGKFPTFSTLRKICDLLYDAKENFHLIFKRVLNPKKKIFEQADKLTPDSLELMLMNNIGILFHRVMVARELRYIIDHYSGDSDEYKEAKTSLEMNLGKLNKMFVTGMEITLKILHKYKNNVLLLIYFLEHRTMLKKLFKKQYSKIMEILTQDRSMNDIYLECAKYYLENGWYKQAQTILKSVLRKKPESEEAADLLAQIKEMTTNIEA